MITHHIITDDEKFKICQWNYTDEYSVYNLLPYSELKEKKQGFFDPEKYKNYRTYYDGDVLIGYTNIAKKGDEIFIGIGVKPELCSMGYGEKILRLACEIANEMYPDKILALNVRSWNKRAIACYKKVGFEIDGEEFEQITPAGRGMFYKMIKQSL